MNKQVPSLGKILIMVGFALLCFVLLLWLWLSFGGTTPMKANGYRFSVSFGEATQLAKEADVRIAGVNVGKVKGLETNKLTGESIATIQMKPKFVPIPQNTRATLRQKTLLGETYVELSPGDANSPAVPEGGALARAQVSPTVELDEILRTFDPKTRKALSNWIIQQAVAFQGRSVDVSELIGNLPGFEEESTKVLKTLNSQAAAVKEISKATATVLNAATERDGQLQTLITSSDKVFATTGRRNADLAAAIKALPTFERELNETASRLTKFAGHTDPLVKQLLPAAKELSPTVKAIARTAPDLNALVQGVGPLVKASERGLPATTKFIKQVQAFLPELSGPLSELAPVIDGANLYRDDITALLGNATAATNLNDTINGGRERSHVLRVTNPLNPEGLSIYTSRLPTTRQNAYPLPGAGRALATSGGLAVYDDRNCDAPEMAFDVDGNGVINDVLLQSIIDNALSGGTVKGGSCARQPRYSLGGQITRFPQVRANPSGLEPGLPVP